MNNEYEIKTERKREGEREEDEGVKKMKKTICISILACIIYYII